MGKISLCVPNVRAITSENSMQLFWHIACFHF
jgi:hypothetical protein